MDLNETVNQVPSTGYASRAYAESLTEFGELLQLPRSGGFLLKRNIPGTSYFDAMGCYPMFFCSNWAGLVEDLADLPDELVTVSLVADPFGRYDRGLLDQCFDVVNPYKTHYVVGLQGDEDGPGTRRHRKTARRALRKLQIEECRDPAGFLDQWIGLYGALVLRYDIRGIRAFSRNAFRQQLSMPEIIVHQAFHEGQIVGAQLFFVQDGVAHCHLGSVSEEGYRIGAFYALDAYSFEFFKDRAQKVDLGGAAGLSHDTADGLSRYKSGWSNETKPVYFCGRVINKDVYAELAGSIGLEGYFPAYRRGELG